jgi:hypothetical protein
LPAAPAPPVTPAVPPSPGAPPAAPPNPPATPAAPAAPTPEHLVAFDGLTTDLKWTGRAWQLTSGDVVLKDFGRREVEARQALRLVRELGLNQYGTVGGPNPVLEYWLTDGKAPAGLVTGLHTLPLDPAALKVEQTQGQWCLRDARRVLFNFGDKESDARQALALVAKYNFTEVGVVGQGAPAMLVFLAAPGGPGLPAAPPPIKPPSIHPIPLAHDPAASPGVPSPFAPGARESGVNDGQKGDVGKPGDAEPAHPVPGAPNSVFNTPPLPGAPASPGAAAPAAEPPARKPGAVMAMPVLPAIPHLRSNSAFAAQTLPGLDDLAERVPFDWRQAQLRQDGKNWKLAVGGRVLADFGADERAARVGLSAVQYYRFTEQCQVGGDGGRFSYYLVNGQPPRGTLFGVDARPFQPDRLEARQVEGKWAVCEGDQPLVRLGDKPEEAQHMLETIRRNQFDRLCRLGTDGDKGMTFLVRAR